MQEKRLQRRVGIEVPIQVCRPDSDVTITARYQDLSWGGASFVTNDLTIQCGQRLIMRLPWTNGQFFAIEADVVRCEPLEAEGYLVITAFGTYRVGQSLLLLIEYTDDFPGLRLRARVKSQSIDDQGDCERPCLVTLELGFEHPLDELRKLAQLSMRYRSKRARFIGPHPGSSSYP